MTPYVYVSTYGESRDVRRNAPAGARIAVQFPDMGRCVELEASANGTYVVSEGPGAAHGGEWKIVAGGRLT